MQVLLPLGLEALHPLFQPTPQVLLFLTGAFKCECPGNWGVNHAPRKMGAHESSFLEVYKAALTQVKLGLSHGF